MVCKVSRAPAQCLDDRSPLPCCEVDVRSVKWLSGVWSGCQGCRCEGLAMIELYGDASHSDTEFALTERLRGSIIRYETCTLNHVTCSVDDSPGTQ